MILTLLFSLTLVAREGDFPFKVNKGIVSTELEWSEYPMTSYLEASKYMDKRQQVVEEQFSPSYDPYNGHSTVPEICMVANMPKRVKSSKEENQYLLQSVYTSAQKTIGDCSNTDTLKKMQYLQLYCKHSKKIYILKYSYPKTADWLLKPVASCWPKK